MTINNNAGPFGFCNWNENNLNPLSRNNWRASLVPAAAVIPAPVAYIKVVAVKKLVVEFRERSLDWLMAISDGFIPTFWLTMVHFIGCHGEPGFLL